MLGRIERTASTVQEELEEVWRKIRDSMAKIEGERKGRREKRRG